MAEGHLTELLRQRVANLERENAGLRAELARATTNRDEWATAATTGNRATPQPTVAPSGAPLPKMACAGDDGEESGC